MPRKQKQYTVTFTITAPRKASVDKLVRMMFRDVESDANALRRHKDGAIRVAALIVGCCVDEARKSLAISEKRPAR